MNHHSQKELLPPRGIGPVKDQEFNDNDVLCGRGAHINSRAGNVQMRQLAQEVRHQYLNESTDRFEKMVLADKLVRKIRPMDPPGRFLKQDASSDEWWDIGDVQARNKVAQALRESTAHTKKKNASPKSTDGAIDPSRQSLPAPLGMNTMQGLPCISDGMLPVSPNADHGLPLTLSQMYHKRAQEELQVCRTKRTSASSFQDQRKEEALTRDYNLDQVCSPYAQQLANGRMFLWRDAMLFPGLASHHGSVPLQQQHDPQVSTAVIALDSAGASLQALASSLHFNERHGVFASQTPHATENQPREARRKVRVHQRSARTRPHEGAKVRCEAEIKAEQEQPAGSAAASGSSTASLNRPVSQSSKETDDTDDSELAAAFLLSNFCEEFDTPRFTEEQVRKEQQEMTEEEQLELRSDLFGDLCEVAPRKKKVARSDEPVRIPLLLEEMRSAIEKTPVQNKSALVQAQEKCCRDEFSDERLELFLRCEDMVPENAAQRFIKYWTKRLELFGPDKFHLPMTLDGALRDDNVALRIGVLSVLARPDISGRPIFVYEPPRHTGVGYTRDSLLRAIWYVTEAVAQSPNAKNNGTVFLCWMENMTPRHFDRRLESNLCEMQESCLPVKHISNHVAGVPTTVAKLIKPIILALIGKRLRARMVVHDICGEELLEALWRYGIGRDVLPDYMGGTAQWTHHEWLEKRRMESK